MDLIFRILSVFPWSVALAAAVGCAGRPVPEPPKPQPGPFVDLPAFAAVADGIYRGGQPARRGFEELKQMGVRTVVDLRVFDTDTEALAGLGLNYVHISFKPNHPETEDVVEFLQLVTDPKLRPVFVHCKRGTDRTGMMTAVYRIAIENWSRDRAIDEMMSMGFRPIWEDMGEYVAEFDVDALKKRLARARKPRVERIP